MSLGEPAATVTIVGAGASGTLTAVQLLTRATHSGAALRVVLVDRTDRFGRGVAYGTTDLRHRLNVPARKMSALPGQPDHLLTWLWSTGQPADPMAFLPRTVYGDYLCDV